MTKHTLTRGIVAAVVAGGVLCSAGIASAAVAPNPAASCGGQFNVGGTPNGTAGMPAGFIGQYTSSGVRALGGGNIGPVVTAISATHGSLDACMASLG